MKVLVVILAFVALAQTEDEIDWSEVKSAYIRVPWPEGVEIPEMPELANNSNENIIAPLIVGGTETTPNTIPYQVAILATSEYGSYFYCAGSLISSRYVLTAAHCLDYVTQVEVRLGAHLFDDTENTQVRLFSSSFTQHPEWDMWELVNDIAVIELSLSIPSSINIQYVDLPSYSDVSNTYNGTLARISGWGRESDSSYDVSPVLRDAYVRVISNFICNVFYLGMLSNSHICTSGLDGSGVCNGDSGGALVVDNKQIGIVSFISIFGCEMRWPSGFTRVTSHLDWIAENTDVTILP